MARKTKSQRESEAIALLIIIFFAIVTAPATLPIWWIENNVEPKNLADGLSVVIGFVYTFIILLFFAVRHKRRRKYNERSEERAVGIILNHKESLGIQCLHKIKKDIYGTENTEKWIKEIVHFFDTQLSDIHHYNYSEFRRKCFVVIDGVGRRERERLEEQVVSDPEMIFSPDMTGLEFEDYCGVILRKSGWDADVTRASGDQGADIIARRGGVKAVFQCKLYKKRSVGNAAVQQAHAARLHYRADIAVVVGDTGFSDSAEVLAATTNVELLDHRQLRSWALSRA